MYKKYVSRYVSGIIILTLLPLIYILLVARNYFGSSPGYYDSLTAELLLIPCVALFISGIVVLINYLGKLKNLKFTLNEQDIDEFLENNSQCIGGAIFLLDESLISLENPAVISYDSIRKINYYDYRNAKSHTRHYVIVIYDKNGKKYYLKHFTNEPFFNYTDKNINFNQVVRLLKKSIPDIEFSNHSPEHDWIMKKLFKKF